jgi:Rieske 2Fe-2S family protein
MARFPKPPEGSWTQHYPELGTAPVSYEDSISPEFYEVERKAVFKRAWLNVGRVEQLPRKGSYFTKELKVANTSIIVVRTTAGEIKAYHNICRHRGNKLVWNDMPLEETSGVCRQFTCKYHAWRYDLDGNLTFVHRAAPYAPDSAREMLRTTVLGTSRFSSAWSGPVVDDDEPLWKSNTHI